MKIEDIVQHPYSLPVQKKGSPVEGKEVDFRQVLEDAKARQPEHQQTGAPVLSSSEIEKSSTPVFPIPSVSPVSSIEDLTRTRSEGIDVTENTLGILEEYQKAMADPRNTLRQVESLVQSLSQEVKNLNHLAEKMSPSDPLQRIMDELGIVSSVEIERFNRGDYI